MKIVDLKCNYLRNPMGIELHNVTFSWKCEEAKGKYAKMADFSLAEDESFEKVIFEESAEEVCKGWITPYITLSPGKVYYWKVSVTDDEGDFAESDIQHFEGGHPGEKFNGKWITPSFSHELHPVMRKSFDLSREEFEKIKRSRLYICGLGLYEAYINGEKIGDEYLTPYFTDYRYWIQYQTYDIGKYLKEGENTLDVFLGNGWYKGRFGYLAYGQMREYYGDEFLLIADMILKGDDYEKIISTDESWACLKSPVALSGIYDGEVWDSRKLYTLENPTDRDISKVCFAEPPKGKLSPMTGLPVKAHERIKPAQFITTPAGELVIDFGQEITGYAEFSTDAENEHAVVLEYGEVLQDGNFYRDNLRTADAKYTFIGCGKKQRARAHFTFFGFRYVKVSGLSPEDARKADFEAVALYSELEETGYIQTSNEKVNRLILNTKWGQKGNFLDIPTDCPQRDERCGWTGDAQIFSGTASYHMETPAFFRKYMKDMLFEQHEKDGAVPYVVPDILTIGREKMGEPEFDMTKPLWGEAGASVWGDAAVIIPWNMYLHYGNRVWLSEQYENMKSWTDFIIHMDEEHCGGKRLWDCGFHFGDWLSLDVEGDATGMDNRDGGTDKYFVSSLYYMVSSGITAKAAEILGKEKDAEYYGKISNQVRDALRSKYVEAKGTLTINSQTAYAIAIWFNLFEEEEMEIAADRLTELLEKWNHHLATGFVGTAFLCSALTKIGKTEEAFTLLLNEDYPSWLYEVNLGATTIWERWNSLLEDGRISGTGMNSLNHYAYGVIAEWVYTMVCGINVDEEHIAGTTMRITPHADKRLPHVSAEVNTMTGKYVSGYSLEEDKVIYEFEVPFGGEAVFVSDITFDKAYVNGEEYESDKLSSMKFTKGKYVIEIPQ